MPDQYENFSRFLDADSAANALDFRFFSDPPEASQASTDRVGILVDPRIRVFVMGVEISSFLSQVSWSNSADNTEVGSSATITLLSPKSIFTLTDANIYGNEGKGTWRLPDSIDTAGPDTILYSERIKKELYGYKKSHNFFDSFTLLPRWNLTTRTLIFHSSDTVRIFARVPWMPPKAKKDGTPSVGWLPVFTGYLEDPSFQTQMSGEETIILPCSNIVKKLSKARVLTSMLSQELLNAGGVTSRVPSDNESFGLTGQDIVDVNNIYTDLAYPTMLNNVLYGANLEGLISYIFYGDMLLQQTMDLSGAAGNKDAKKEQAAQKYQQSLANVAIIEAKLKDPNITTSERDLLKDRLVKAKAEKAEAEVALKKAKPDAFKTTTISRDEAIKKFNAGNSRPFISGNAADEAKVKALQAPVETSILDSNTYKEFLYKRGWGNLDPRLFVQARFPLSVPAFDYTADNQKEASAVKGTGSSTSAAPTSGASTSAAPTSGATKAAGASSSTSDSKTSYAKITPVPAVQQKSGQQFGAIRSKPNRCQPHQGVDFSVKNAEVKAPIDGWVVRTIIENPKAGNVLYFLGRDGSLHLFAHLKTLAPGSGYEGQEVKLGTVLATSGGEPGQKYSGTNSSGSHLHWGVWKPKTSSIDTSKPILPQIQADISGSTGSRQYMDPLIWVSENNTNYVKFISPGGSTPAPTDSSIKAPAAVTPKVVTPKAVTPKAVTKEKSFQTTEIDWEKEEAQFSRWHRCCLTGFANGVPDWAKATTSIDVVDSDAEEFLSAAQKRATPYLDYDEVTIIGRNSGWLGVYSPHGKAVSVALLKPTMGWGFNKGVGGLEVQNVQGFDIGATSRASIVSELLQRIDYCWWVTGNGDVIFEFPQYEMIPSHYSPSWERMFRVAGTILRDDFKENFETLKSCYLFKCGITGVQVEKAGAEDYSRIMGVVYKIAPVLVRNGAEIEIKYWPYITSKERLATLGALHIRKIIANAYTYNTSQLPPLLYITPNRPLHYVDADIYALVRGTSFTWTLSGQTIDYKLQMDLSALRLRLTPEQRFIRDQLANGVQPDKIDTSKFDASQYPSQTIQIDEGKLWSARGSAQTGYSANTSGTETERLEQLTKNYGFIFGTGELLIDYRKTYSHNGMISAKYSAFITGEDGKSKSNKSGSIITFPGQQNRAEATEPSTTVGAEDTTVEVPNGSSTFSDAKSVPESVKPAFAAAKDAFNLGPEASKALTAHANVASNFQSNYVPLDVQGKLVSDNFGLMGWSKSSLGQLTDNYGFNGLLAKVPQCQDFSSSKLNDNAAVVDTLQKVQASADPRLDPTFSTLASGLASKQLLDGINSGNTTNQGSYDFADVNPDLFAYATQFGPEHPALKLTIAENSKLVADPSFTSSEYLASKLQDNLVRLGGYKKSDLDYINNYRKVKSDADTFGFTG